MAVTRDYVATVLCAYVIVWGKCNNGKGMKRKMHDDENPIPSLMDDENGD